MIVMITSFSFICHNDLSMINTLCDKHYVTVHIAKKLHMLKRNSGFFSIWFRHICKIHHNVNITYYCYVIIIIIHMTIIITTCAYK